MSSITSANAKFFLSIGGLYTTPQQIQEFAADDIFDFGDVTNAEIMMGADGFMAVGWVPNIVPQNITLMANSKSNVLFDAWAMAEKSDREKRFANGLVTLTATGMSYTLTKGVLTQYNPVPAAKKVLQPRKFVITWESVTPIPV